MKTIKKILCLTLSILLCFTLIGCNKIDKMRETQIHFNNNGNLVYNGYEYKLLTSCNALSPTLDKNLNITDTDVPVLLSNIYGERAYLSKDEKYIQTTNDYYENLYYARVDIYDSIAQRIKFGDYFDGYCFYYGYHDESTQTYKQERKFVSEKSEEALNSIFASGTPDNEVDIDLLGQYAIISILACSNDFLFEEYVATIYQTNKNIYIAYSGDFEKEIIFKVDEKYYDAVNEIIESYKSLAADYKDFE